MGLSVIPGQFVKNVQSIQGSTQVLNSCYFVQALIQTLAEVFKLARLEVFISPYKFHGLPFVNVISLAHRVALFALNIQRPKKPSEKLRQIEHGCIELFFIVKKYLPANENLRNNISDLMIAFPYILNGCYNWRGKKTVYEKSTIALDLAIEKVLHLEVSIETSRDLQRIQRSLRNEKEIHQIHKEMAGLKTIIEKRLDDEIKELTELKTMMKGSLNEKSQKDRELEQKEQRLIRGLPKDPEIIKKNPEVVKIKMQRREIDLAQKLKDLPDIIKATKIELDQKINLNTIKQRNSMIIPPEEDAEIANLQVVLRRLKLIDDMILLEEEINSLEELRKHDYYKLNRKKTVLNDFIIFIEENFILKSMAVTQFQEVVKKQTENFSFLSGKIDIQRLKISKDLAERFDRLYDIKYLEEITAKFFDCLQLVIQLKNATEPDRPNGVIDPEKKIDFYTGINAEIELVKEIIKQFETRCAAGQSKIVNETFNAFKGKILDYFTAVQLIFGKEDPVNRGPLFERVEIAVNDVENALQKLRVAFKQDQKELLSLLIDEKKSLEKSAEWNQRWERFSGPYSKILFGALIIVVRIFKHFEAISSRSRVDLSLDALFLGCLVYHSASRVLLKKNRPLRQNIEIAAARS